MTDLIKKLQQYPLYNKSILNNPDNIELGPKNGMPWLFFNRNTIIEYTNAYNIQKYRGKHTLFIAQEGDDGLFAIFEKKTK